MTIKLGPFCWQAFAGASDQPQNVWNSEWLSPSKWAGREPWYITRTGGTTLTGRCDTQAVRDAQIGQAHACGLDYFAYNIIPSEYNWLVASTGNTMWNPAHTGVELHRTSPNKGLVKYCVNIICGTPAGAGSEWFNSPATFATPLINWLVTACDEPEYFTVGAGRPVIYLFSPPSLIADTYSGNATNAAAFITALRSAITGAGMPNPYIIGDWTNGTGTIVADMADLSLDAVSLYTTTNANAEGETYASYAGRNYNEYATLEALGFEMVPTVSCGWDYEPISESGGIVGSYCPPGVGEAVPGNWSHGCTPALLASATQSAIDFIDDNPSACPYGLIVIYALGENTECASAFEPSTDDNGMRYQMLAQQLLRQRDNKSVMRARGLQNISR